MNTKVSFGFDYLNIMANADVRSGSKNSLNGYNLARVFLMTSWGLTTEEQDSANQLFWQALNNNSFEDMGVVINRFVSHMKNDLSEKTKFLTEMMTLNYLDGILTDDERDFTLAFANELDFRRSEVEEIERKAIGYAMAYTWFGDNYVKKVPDISG